ncbi:light-regulated signal transduction histidine kinase (bacteriophytochrome) [Lewinella aquimaris]|uniref:histidine kinase n=1 Tax=Neolewinella aquimaris TaxID=1835722 RepID=A0A840E8D6_9BACT|nr:ATP-binding protein [Neolewinella aquimaris]MBB4080193.1 light-regulated signal transduction histidine kinase (bacteriophytochrome) [Neolewinella aquimaris]
MHLQNDPVANSVREVYPYRVDLENCENEPLRHIRVVQSFACLIAVDSDTLIVRHVSENTDRFLGLHWEEIIDRPLSSIFNRDLTEQLSIGLGRENGFESLNPIQTLFTVNGQQLLKNVIVHREGNRLLLEIENSADDFRTSGYQQILARAVARIQNINNHNRLFTETAAILRQLTGYDRVMVYRFDKNYNGEVIAESLNKDKNLEPFHGLFYPHTDIPKQARELYLKNRVRLISDITVPPSNIRSSPQAEEKYLDLSMAGSRGVSPIHLEYLGYMGVNNSLSVAIILGDKLWGLFALHHYSPKTVDYGLRNLLLFLGQIFSGHLSMQAAGSYREKTLTRNLVRLALGEHISKTRDIFTGLTEGSYTLMNIFAETSGAAISFEGRVETMGETPPTDAIQKLTNWVTNNGVDHDSLIYTSDSIGKEYKPFQSYCDYAAGVLIIYLNPDHADWICWFRPGLSRKITWGGKPEKELIVSEQGTRRLGPRRSFERYVETVDGCSAPWDQGEIDTAYTLRITIINSMIQHYSEVKQTNERLKKAYEDLETFSYTVSHDLRAPLRAINGYAEILEEEYGQRMDDEARTLIGGIQRGVDQMNTFITDILELSRVGTGGLKLSPVDVSPLANEIVAELRPLYARTPDLEIRVVKDLPPVVADRRLLRQLYTNLVSNALKYMEPTEDGRFAVEIGCRPPTGSGPLVYTVSNSGSGIEEEYLETIFQMFSRLSSNSQTEGTGVGLAIVERITSRHNGKVWVTNDGLGVTFNFYLSPENANDYVTSGKDWPFLKPA